MGELSGVRPNQVLIVPGTFCIEDCSTHDLHLCWNCVKKAALTTKLTCTKCGHEVHRVDEQRICAGFFFA